MRRRRFAEVISLDPNYKASYGERGFAYYRLGDLGRARASCETNPTTGRVNGASR